MILWQDVSSTDRITPPPWLDGAADLQARECVEGRLWAAGDPRLVGPRLGAWVALDDGWRALVLPGFDPLSLARSVPWCPTVAVPDVQGRSWSVACPRNALGESRIVGTYDEAFVRILTPEQAHLERLSLAAREGINAALPDDDATPAKAPTMAQLGAWAVGAICAGTHISPQALGRLGLLDEEFVRRVAFAVAGIRSESP